MRLLETLGLGAGTLGPVYVVQTGFKSALRAIAEQF